MNESVEKHLRKPIEHTAADRARASGVDLTLLIEQLRLSAQERVDKLQQAMRVAEQIRGRAGRSS